MLYCNVSKDWVNAVGRDTPHSLLTSNVQVLVIRDVVKRLDTLRDIIYQRDKPRLRMFERYYTETLFLGTWWGLEGWRVIDIKPLITKINTYGMWRGDWTVGSIQTCR